MLAMQELGCFQLPGIVYRSLQHGAVHYHAATWGDGRGWMAQQWASGSRHGISVHSKCHQKKLCPVMWKPGFFREENTSPKCQTPSNLPTQVSYDDELHSGQDPNVDDKHADELPWDGFWQFAQKFFGYANRLLQQLFSTWTLLLRSHAVVIAAVCGFALSCWNTHGLPWNTHHLEGSICCSKTFIYLSASIVPSKTCKLIISYALMHPHTIRDACFWTECWSQARRSPSSLARRTQHRTKRRFWTMFTYGFLKTIPQTLL